MTSSEVPYFRHTYDSYPAILKASYAEGGVIPPYQDDHGTWLSAFAPIKTEEGDVLGVVQVDRFYEDFKEEAYTILKQDLLVSGLALVAVMGLMVLAVGRMVKEEKKFVDHLEVEVEARTQEVAVQKEAIEGLLTEAQDKNEELVAAEEELRQQSEELITINETLEQTHQEVLAKTTKLTDSLQYAQRIQSTILPPASKLRQALPEHFVFFKPRDFVSGDFYWVERRGHRTIVAAVDCTGHGVPGAFMSLLGTNALNHMVKNRGMLDPGLILDALHQDIQATLDQKKTHNRDGMDAALLVIDQEKRQIQFAGAKNPLLLVKENGEEVLIKGDRFSVGGRKAGTEKEYFTTHTLPIEHGMSCYLYSDGFQDQFGGPDNRKFLSRTFRSLLVENASLPMADQAELLGKQLADWRQGERHVQTDDILVIGVRL